SLRRGGDPRRGGGRQLRARSCPRRGTRPRRRREAPLIGLIRTSVVRPIGLTIIYLAIALFGYVSLQKLAIDLLPSVDVPWISITTSYEGVAPEEVEGRPRPPIEQAVATVEGGEGH